MCTTYFPTIKRKATQKLHQLISQHVATSSANVSNESEMKLCTGMDDHVYYNCVLHTWFNNRYINIKLNQNREENSQQHNNNSPNV